MTQDNGFDVSPSWQELKEERDAAVWEAEVARNIANAVVDERDALADWANEVADVVRDKRFGSSHVELALWLGRQVRKAPTSILMRLSKEKAGGVMDEQLSDAVARLIAEKQAEALEEAADGMAFDERTSWMLRRLADQKRRQTQEPQP